MAIHRLLQNSALGPEEIERMTAAYEGALRALDLNDRDNSIKEIVARKIVEITQTGERDPNRILTLALSGLGLPATAQADSDSESADLARPAAIRAARSARQSPRLRRIRPSGGDGN